VIPLEARLAELAALGQTITYGVLARDLGLRIGDLTAALEALMEQDAAAERPFRAVLCSGRLGNGQPAPGFFLKAAELGRISPHALPADQAAFVAGERAALFLPLS
jgi:hypothetical protein